MAVKCSNRTLWSTADEDGYPYWVEFEDRPFSKGNSKFMYKGRLNGKGPRSGDYCTVKVFRNIEIARHDDWSLYISRVETANKLAAQFNKRIDNQYRVKFIVPMLALVDISSTCTDCIYFLSNTKRIMPDDSVAIEPYIGSKFRKFYRNSPLKGAEHAYILQAFSHFTASQTGDTLICGLQGEAHGTEFVLTNPIIHSANQQWGPKDQGAHGFRKFFSAHTCNDICQSMDLPDYLETMSVTEEIDHGVVDTKQSVEDTEQETLPKEFVSTENLDQTVTQAEVSSLPQAEAQISEPPKDIKETPAILQTPPMSHVGRTIVAPVSMAISLSRSSSVTGPPVFAEDLPGESISRPPAESEILDATPFDDITTQVSDSQEVLPPPSSEYLGPFTPCRTVSEYLELKKNFAPFSPGSESIPMIDDELACAESELQETVPPPCDDFEPTLSPSLNSYLKDRESTEIIPHGSMDLDLESQQSISFFDDNLPAPDLGSMNNFQMMPGESVTQDMEIFESLVNTPCETMSQESLVTTPCGSIRQEIDSQPSIVSTPKDSVSQDLIPVSEPPIESDLQLDLPGDAKISQDSESQVCLVSIPPDSMDHHLDTIESLEALSPASEKLSSVEVIAEPMEEHIEPGAGDVEEQISAQEFSEVQTIQDTVMDSSETYPLDNVEVEVQKSLSVDTISSDFKQSLETIPEGSNESDSAQSLEISEMPATERIPEEVAAVESSDGVVVDNQTVVASDVGFSGQEETCSEIQSGPMFETPETGVTEETVTSENFVSENITIEPSTETAGEDAGVCQDTAVEESVEPVCEATVGETSIESVVGSETIPEPVISSQESSLQPVTEAVASQETSVEPVAETMSYQETSAEPVAETVSYQESSVEPVTETVSYQESSVEPVAETVSYQESSVEPVAETVSYQESSVEPVAETVSYQESSVEPVAETMSYQDTSVEPLTEAMTSQETTIETSVEPIAETITSQESFVEPVPITSFETTETSVEPAAESMTSQEITTEPIPEVMAYQETTVEKSFEPESEVMASGESITEPGVEATTSQETTTVTSDEVTTTAEVVGEVTTSQETTIEPVAEATVSQEITGGTSVEPMGESTTSQETIVGTSVEPTISQETTVETTVEPIGESTTSQETTVQTTVEPMGESATSQETTVETTVEPMGESATSQETTVQTTVEPMGESATSHETTVETTVEPMGESATSQETTVETTVEPMGEYTASQETTVETTVEPMGEYTTSQGTTVETSVEPMGEPTISQETTVETTVEPMGEYTTSQETTVETSVEPMGDSTTSQETTVETIVEPMGESATSQETTVETTVEPIVESTTSQETIVDTSAEPMGETTISQETTVETTIEPIGESTTSQETTVETTAEPVCDSMPSQETNVESVGEVATTVQPVREEMVTQESIVETASKAMTPTEPIEEAMVTQETTVQTSVEPIVEVTTPVGETVVTQETTVETSMEPLGESVTTQKINIETSEPVSVPMTSQETIGEAAVVEVTQEPGIEKTTVDSTEQCYMSENATGSAMQESYVYQDPEIGESNVNQETTVEDMGEGYVVQDHVAETTSVEITRESDMNQETAAETPSGNIISQGSRLGSSEGNAYQSTFVESTFKATGDDYVYQDTGSGSTAGESFACQEMVGGSAVGATGDWNVYRDSRFETIGEGYVCQDSAGEPTFESSKMAETSEEVYVNQNTGFDPSVKHYMSQSIEFESNVESSADGYTGQDSGFGSVVDTNPAEYSHRDESFTMNYNTDPGSNMYPQSFETATSSYPTESTTNQTADSYYYGLPPEYRIKEECRSSQCEAGCPHRYPKMTIIPDLDTMEFVETKRLDSVCEEHDTQQGIETLPRRKVSYYLEPKESHEIITFRINISPENPNDSIYQNFGSVCQGSSMGESGLSSTNYCSSCQPRETSENIPETSRQDSQRSSSFYSYRCSSINECVETIPQRNCGYNSDIHKNVSTDWSSTRPM